METTKKNKLLIIIVILLLLINVGTISSVWIAKSKQSTERVLKKKIIKGKSHSSRGYFIDELNLSEEQTGLYKEFKKEHFKKIHILRDSIHLCKHRINDELFKTNTNKEYIKELADSIGEMNSRFEKANYEHFLAVKSILSSEQLGKFKLLINDASHSSKSKRGHQNRR